MTSFHLYDQSLPVITELLNKDSSKVAKVFTLDAQSSIDVRRILSDEDVSFRSSSSRKRKSAESAFDAFSHQSSGSTFFLARDNLSLQLKDLPFMKKFVVNYMCDTLEEGDTVYFYCGDGERSTRIARALIIIFLMCRFDHLLQFESLETVIRKHLTEQNYISLDFSNDFFHQPSQNNRGLVLENSIENCLHRFFNLFNPSPAYNEEELLFMRRITLSTVKDRNYYQGIKKLHREVDENLNSISALSAAATASAEESASSVPKTRFQSQPEEGEGWRVFEFFSGIGGMRLGLPDVIDGIPITKITAFDCSVIANNVYDYNFHHRSDPVRHPAHIASSNLRTTLVQQLSVQAADNAADIWTMSPPCQPFTRTRNARRLDDQDNRSQGLYHLMTLLLNMQYMPRYIMVENVQGFLGSKMHSLWCQVLQKCQYRFHEFLLSPDKTVGLPNSRTRYYCIARFDANFRAQHTDTATPRAVSSLAGQHHAEVDTNTERHMSEASSELAFMQKSGQISSLGADVESTTNTHQKNQGSSNSSDSGDSDAEGDSEPDEISDPSRYHLATVPPLLLDSIYGSHRKTRSINEILGERIESINNNPEILEKLCIAREILTSSWASKMLSIVTVQDQLTYCFTKGYGKRVDHSAGSCLYMNDASDIRSGSELDRSRLMDYFGQLRLFHPDELLLLFGFPENFAFPVTLSKEGTTNSKTMTMQHRWGCIGNSVNVAVIRLVMRCLFEDANWETLK